MVMDVKLALRIIEAFFMLYDISLKRISMGIRDLSELVFLGWPNLNLSRRRKL